MFSERVQKSEFANSCFFRTIASPPEKKVLLQITERCNLHCLHCFVSSTTTGNDITLELFKKNVLPALVRANVTKVTLTGGEPLCHKNIYEILSVLENSNIDVAICSNASLVSPQNIDRFVEYKHLHFNISLDGYSSQSHGRFRGNTSEEFFDNIIRGIMLLGTNHLLHGILVTPNLYTNTTEYIEICELAIRANAHYVLLNPLSEFGRGEHAQHLALHNEKMTEIQIALNQFHQSGDIEIVFLRFPNNNKPLGQCVAGKILYIFANGEITICPYIVFAAKSSKSLYKPSDFIFANVLDENCNIDAELENYVSSSFVFLSNRNDLHVSCYNCTFSKNCQKGCLASIIAQGAKITDIDTKMCPIVFESN